ncbi:MAG TPA: hypothetical protein PKD72_15765, partial [Gemmatales bacterium]|nr:hypothetical protein [Gemmatales bacterium]
MKYLLILPWLLLILAGCQPRYSSAAATESDEELPEKLSELGLFIGEPGKQIPATGVHSYELRTPLFSDYTLKYRFIKLPDKGHFEFRGPDETLWFPEGTIIAKTFAYPVDQRNPELGHKLLETRILRKQGDTWQGASYVWNDEQTDAQQKITGKIIPSSWIHTDGSTRQNDYIVPNANQCKGCHGNQNEPIGPKPRNLLHAEFARELLSSSSVVPLAIWNHPDSGSLHERAKAWLDINCAHCHNPSGP